MIQKYLARVLPRNSVFNPKSTLVNFLQDYGIKQNWLSKRMASTRNGSVKESIKDAWSQYR